MSGKSGAATPENSAKSNSSAQEKSRVEDSKGDVTSSPKSERTSPRSRSETETTTTESDGESFNSADNVSVVVRVRPLNQGEKDRGDKYILKLPGEGAVWIDNSYGQIKPFTLSATFGEEATQEDVFQDCGVKKLVEMSLQGYSCTSFAFGQTGSGKTYTITGPIGTDAEEHIMPSPDMYGLIQRSFQYLFEKMDSNNVTYTLKTSYLEIYNEKVKDLLNPSNAHDSLPVRWSSHRGFYVENLFVLECETCDDLMAVLEEGLKCRQVGSHAMNDYSSRSHSMLTINIDIESEDEIDENSYPIVKHGKLSFVDLAGSERVKETRATGETMAESNNINKSLLTLGNCISALGDSKKRTGHIPYRDSKLTRLLADSLGGNGVTLMIACISPSSQYLSDTLNTLRYASRAKKIKNKPVIQMDPKEQLILGLKREMKLLRNENAYFRNQIGMPSGVTAAGRLPEEGKLDSNTLNVRKNSRVTSGESSRATSASFISGASSSLYDMLQEYMVENEHLRLENVDLLNTREGLLHGHGVVCRENERLVRKLESLQRVLVNSPFVRTPSRGRSASLDNLGDPENVQTPQRKASSDPPSVRDTSAQSNISNDLAVPKVDKLTLPPVSNHGPYPNYVSQSSVETSPLRTPQNASPPLENGMVEEQQSQPSSSLGYSNKEKKKDLSRKTNSAPNERESDKGTSPTKPQEKSTVPKPVKKKVPVEMLPVQASEKQSSGYASRFAQQKEFRAKHAPKKDAETKTLGNTFSEQSHQSRPGLGYSQQSTSNQGYSRTHQEKGYGGYASNYGTGGYSSTGQNMFGSQISLGAISNKSQHSQHSSSYSSDDIVSMNERLKQELNHLDGAISQYRYINQPQYSQSTNHPR